MCMRIGGVLAILLAVGGCASVQSSRVRVVDASNGQAVSGVRGEAVFSMYQPSIPFCWPVLISFPEEHAESDPSGLLQFKQGWSEFKFEKDGYEPCGIASDWHGFKLRNELIHLRSLPHQEDGTVLVSLRPLKRE